MFDSQVTLDSPRLTVNFIFGEKIYQRGSGRTETVCDEHELVFFSKHSQEFNL